MLVLLRGSGVNRASFLLRKTFRTAEREWLAGRAEMMKEILSRLADAPVIAAVKNGEDLEAAMAEENIKVLFLLYGDVCSVGPLIHRARQAGKAVIVHLDLIEGLESKPVSVRFIREQTEADGIISTKVAAIKAAKEAGLIAVQRFFVIDSIAVSNIHKQLEMGAADIIEVLPAVMPKVLRRLAAEVRAPLIAGGLLSDKEDVIQALSAGAIAVSTTRRELWRQ